MPLVRWKPTDISKEHTASIFGWLSKDYMYIPEDKYLHNNGFENRKSYLSNIKL
jgi:hypothetical protein